MLVDCSRPVAHERIGGQQVAADPVRRQLSHARHDVRQSRAVAMRRVADVPDPELDQAVTDRGPRRAIHPVVVAQVRVDPDALGERAGAAGILGAARFRCAAVRLCTRERGKTEAQRDRDGDDKSLR